MKSTLPLPKGRVTSSGMRPVALRRVECTASTSAPGAYPPPRRTNRSPGRFFQMAAFVASSGDQHGEEMARAFRGEQEMRFARRAEPLRLCRVEFDGQQVAAARCEPRVFSRPRGPGSKTSPLPCCSTSARMPSRSAVGELVPAQPHVAEENDVELRKLLLAAGKCGEVIEAAARAPCRDERAASRTSTPGSRDSALRR